MEKRLGMHLSGQDVYVNVVGGMHIDEPAIDLGIVAAVTSSLREVPVEPGLLVLGEVGLGGEVRAISQAELRIREAAKMGFKRCLLPERNLAKAGAGGWHGTRSASMKSAKPWTSCWRDKSMTKRKSLVRIVHLLCTDAGLSLCGRLLAGCALFGTREEVPTLSRLPRTSSPPC